jgi:endonuclease YncB( thermonuclease family)
MYPGSLSCCPCWSRGTVIGRGSGPLPPPRNLDFASIGGVSRIRSHENTLLCACAGCRRACILSPSHRGRRWRYIDVAGRAEAAEIRLANIDAPEKHQAFGQVSRTSLSEICILAKTEGRHAQDIDRYGRTVAIVRCAGVEVNRAQVERGMAWVYPKYNKDKSLPGVQEQAREARRG